MPFQAARSGLKMGLWLPADAVLVREMMSCGVLLLCRRFSASRHLDLPNAAGVALEPWLLPYDGQQAWAWT